MERETPSEEILFVSPTIAEDAKRQCNSFKSMMWNALGQRNHDGAWLHEFEDKGVRGVSVLYHKDIPGAEDYARQAKEISSDVTKALLFGRPLPKVEIAHREHIISRRVMTHD